MKRPLIQSTLLAAVTLALPLTLIGCNKSADTGTDTSSTPPSTTTTTTTMDTNSAAPAPSMDTNAPATNMMATPDTNAAASTNAMMPATNSGQ